MNIQRRLWVLALSAMPLACSLDDPNVTTLATNLQLDNATVLIGQVIQVAIRTTNVGSNSVTLSGPPGCFLFFRIRDRVQGTVLYVSNTTCTGEVTTMVLAPGLEERETFEWDGRNSAGQRLLSGTYELQVGATVPGKAILGASTLVTVE